MSTDNHDFSNSIDETTTQGEPRPDADVCGRAGCRTTENLARYRDGNGRKRVLCPPCGKEFLGVSS